jgi:Fe2+ transport system protein FeoA
VRLAEATPGQIVRFERLTEAVEQDSASLRYLDDAGFIPGATATVTTRSPDGTLMLDVDGRMLALSHDLCQRLFVVAA